MDPLIIAIVLDGIIKKHIPKTKRANKISEEAKVETVDFDPILPAVGESPH